MDLVYAMDNKAEAEINKLKAENEALRNVIIERSKALYDALSALSGMWYQYCPPPWTHQSMNAGEDAEEVLLKWQLLRPDNTSIQVSGIQVDEDVPDVVLELLTNPIQLKSKQ